MFHERIATVIAITSLVLIIVIANSGDVLTVYAQTTSTLTVSLHIINSVDNLNPDISPSDFQITVTRSGLSPVTFPGSSDGTQVTINNGQTFLVQDPVLATHPEVSFHVDRTGRCGDDNVVIQNDDFCSLDVTLGVSNTNNAAISPSTTVTPNRLALPSGLTNSFAPTGSGATGTGANNLPTAVSNTPFETCRTQEVPNKQSVVTQGTKTSAEAEQINPEQGNILLAPSSATYTILGSVSFDNLANENAKTPWDIQLAADFNRNDVNTLALAAPAFVGNIFVGIPPFHISTTNYDIQKVDTSCDYIALAKPISQNPVGANISPLNPPQGGPLGLPVKHPTRTAGNSLVADIGGLLTNTCIKNNPPAKSKSGKLGGDCGNIKAAENQLLVQNSNGKLVDPNQPGEPIASIAINPPFRSCAGSLGLSPTDAMLANYNIVGDPTPDIAQLVKSGKIDSGTHTLQVVITSDVILSPTDLAKISNNNNPFVKVSLVIDPNTNHPSLVGFNIQQLSTHCKDIAFTSTPQIN
jgi:hypothetical protein